VATGTDQGDTGRLVLCDVLLAKRRVGVRFGDVRPRPAGGGLERPRAGTCRGGEGPGLLSSGRALGGRRAGGRGSLLGRFTQANATKRLDLLQDRLQVPVPLEPEPTPEHDDIIHAEAAIAPIEEPRKV